MKFIFLRIDGDANDYINAKLSALQQRHQEDETTLLQTSKSVLKNAAAQLKNNQPRIAEENEFFNVSKDQLKLVSIAKRCALQELVEDAPLIDGEEIKEDFFSYLLEPYNDIPAFTAVLRRTTNSSVMLYIFDHVLIDNGNLAYAEHPLVKYEGAEAPMLKGFSYTITSEMVKKLLKLAGQKAAAAAFSKLGSVILNIVAKELFGDDTQKMIEEIQRVVKEEIEANELARINGAVTGTLQFLTIEYQNKKSKTDLIDPHKRELLMNELQGYSTKFYTDVIGLLKQDKYAIRGLRSFMTAASVHLLITQEMAIIDPDYMNPNESSYLKTLRDNASDYRVHVDKNYRKAYNDRNNMEVYTKEFVDCITTSCVHKTTYHWRDNVSGERAGEFMGTKKPKKSAYENASASLERHRTEVLNQLKEELGHPQQTFLDGIGEVENFSFPIK